MHQPNFCAAYLGRDELFSNAQPVAYAVATLLTPRSALGAIAAHTPMLSLQKLDC